MKIFLTLCLLAFSFNVVADVIVKPSPFLGSVVFKPADDKTYPGIMLLHGSEGGSIPFTHTAAQALANKGFSVLAFCWFDCLNNVLINPVAPINNIDLAKSFAAFNWLKSSPYVKGKKMGIYGFSRGAEQALILASLSQEKGIDIDAIAVHAPSDVVVQGLSWSWFDKRCFVCKTTDNKCQDRSQHKNFKWNTACGLTPSNTEINAWSYAKKPINVGDRIDIDGYNNPLFISHGAKDKLWSVNRSKKIITRRKKLKQPISHHFFNQAEHILRFDDAYLRHKMVSEFFINNL